MTEKKKVVTREEFESQLIEICYSRTLCEQIGVDYVRMNGEDLAGIRRYLLQQYEVKDRKV